MRRGTQFILGLILAAGVLPAQELPPPMKTVIDRLKANMLRPPQQQFAADQLGILQRPRQYAAGSGDELKMIAPGNPVPVCSVPLIVYNPPDPEPNGSTISIPKGNVDNMPALIMPAPPCKELLSAPPQ